MRLTLHTDYALRALIYLSATREQATAGQIADAFGISKNHLVKVLQTLRDLGYLETVRGRTGGVRLARDPAEITVGEVVRRAQDRVDHVECFDPRTNTCPVTPVCRLRHRLNAALEAYLTVLDGCTIAEMAGNGAELRGLLKL